MTYPCPSVVTNVTLDTQQIKFLIDLMWGHNPLDSLKTAKHHGVDDVAVQCQLWNCLQSALSELD
jgi:hypothetical protein